MPSRFTVLTTLILALLCAITGLVASTPDAYPASMSDLLADAPGLVRALAEGMWILGNFAAHNGRLSLILVAIVFAPVLLAAIIRRIPRAVQKDPIRMFSSEQRRAGFNRCDNRCEMESMPFIRCKRPAEHGDHWFPWSLGGPTDMNNFVGACARCNTSKGAKVPTFWQTWRLEHRRRGYFPAGQHLRPGGRVTAPR